MTKLLHLTLALFIGCQLFAQKTTYFHNNGKIASEGILERGKEVGLWVFFDSTGVKLQETELALQIYSSIEYRMFPSSL